MNETKKIIKEGVLSLAGYELPCFVTEDGERVLASRRMQFALKLVEETTSSGKQPSGKRMDRLLGYKVLQPYLSNYDENHFKPIDCIQGNAKIKGYKAETLADICSIMLQARRDGMDLAERQAIIAQQCEILLEGFARVGIVALIDEATGYQDDRKKDALQKILDAYLSKELIAWTKRFPDEYYENIFRLKGWGWSSLKRPQVIGRYTNDIIYDRLAPNLVEELKAKNPRNEKGHAKNRDHQWLSPDIGHPALQQHLIAVMALMKASSTWEGFMFLLNQAYPKKGSIEDLFPETLREVYQ